MRAFGDGSVRFVGSPSGHLGMSRAVVSERTGGISTPPFATLNAGRSTDDDPGAVRENERIILRSLGLADRVARLRLEHGARVLRPSGPGMYGPADALLTDDPQLVLWFTVADCVPVTITAGSWRAHGHCGWRGIVAGLLEAMVAALATSVGVSPSSLRAWAGPGIGPCCFEIGPEVADRFARAAIRTAPPAPSVPPPMGAVPPGEGVPPPTGAVPPERAHPRTRTFLDLRAEISLRLARLGLPPEALSVDDSCTACDSARFFSHRRDGIPTGRLAALSFTASPGVREGRSATP
jgi:polyphenol oxidase